MNNLAGVLSSQGRYKEAEEMHGMSPGIGEKDARDQDQKNSG